MRIFHPLLLSLTLVTYVFAEGVPKEKHNYQSDVARMRKIVINSLYSHRDVFLRELISNANDALEKLRLTSLTDKEVLDGAEHLNITIKAVEDKGGSGGRLIITDTGIGMTPEELTVNLGTLAKSGTSEFLARAEGQEMTGTGNLIGAFGLGFYSSFLVADHVYVSSIASKSAKNPHPTQYVFSSSAGDNSFETYPDPRGNVLGRGTEITLVLKEDSLKYLDTVELAKLVDKYSAFTTSFPIYLFRQRTDTVVDEEVTEASEKKELPPNSSEVEQKSDRDDDEAVLEEVPKEDRKEDPPLPRMKQVTVDEWSHLNAAPPLWQRDPRTISDDEYKLFYQATFKDFKNPLAWHHFSGDSGTGVSFRAVIYIPSNLDDSFWNQHEAFSGLDVRLMVKRVFITNDLGEGAMPQWARWIKAVVDADDLPLNVSRETLQSTRFLKQIKAVILKHLIALIARVAEEDKEKFAEIQATYGTVLKLGAVEDTKNRDKLTGLTRFHTNFRNNTSLEEYLANKRKGQKQIFYLADLGKPIPHLAKSIFVEKLDARGYEVLLLNEALDEIMLQNLRTVKNIPFQDVAKIGLRFGDEDPEREMDEKKELEEKFQPLLDWLKGHTGDVVRDVVVSSRLVTSPCAVVADVMGYTANVERMMSASSGKRKQSDPMHEFAKKQRLLEINPKSPLIEGLLRRVEQLPPEQDGKDIEAEDELMEVTSILLDGALVRSGFEVTDSHEFFSRVDRVLRRSLGVSETAPTETIVKPAPPVDPEFPIDAQTADERTAHIQLPPELKDKVSIEMEEIDDDGNVVRDEL